MTTEGIRLLLVDDEHDFTSALKRRLDRRGLEVTVADSGEAALTLLVESPMDVVVLDVRMPGMDGLSVLARIKEQWPSVEVVMLTGHASMEVAIRGMELGAFDYLMKPVDFQDLLYKVEDAATRKKLCEEKNADRERGA
jgi:DNA-binding NtrC family response regulator